MSLASCHTSLMFVSKAEAGLSGAPYRLPKRHNTQHNDIQHFGLICNTWHNWHFCINEIQHNCTLSYAQYHYVECRNDLNVMLSVIMLSVVVPALVLLTNIRLTWKTFARTNTLAYFAAASGRKKKVLYHRHLGVYHIFTTVINWIP